MIFAAAELLLSPHALASGLGHPVGTGDYATLAWFTASLATVGGALGAGLESDEAVREAAYASSSDSDEDASFVPQRKEPRWVCFASWHERRSGCCSSVTATRSFSG